MPEANAGPGPAVPRLPVEPATPSPVEKPAFAGESKPRLRVRCPRDIPPFAIAGLKGRTPLFAYVTYTPE